MTDIQRVKKVCKWLIFTDIADSDKELSEILGYTKSSFSQIMNEKVPLSNKFVEKLCSLDENINKVWVLSEEGEMFKDAHPANGTLDGNIKRAYLNIIELQNKKIEEMEEKLKVMVVPHHYQYAAEPHQEELKKEPKNK